MDTSEENTQQIIVDFGEICRLCLAESDELTDIYDETTVGFSIGGFISSKSGIQINQDYNFPSKICPNCLETVNSFNLFLEKCKLSDRTLKEWYKETILTSIKSLDDTGGESRFVESENPTKVEKTKKKASEKLGLKNKTEKKNKSTWNEKIKNVKSCLVKDLEVTSLLLKIKSDISKKVDSEKELKLDYVCFFCHSEQTCISLLIDHYKTNHSSVSYSQILNEILKNNYPLNCVQTNTSTCFECKPPKDFHTSNGLQNHLNSDHGISLTAKSLDTSSSKLPLKKRDFDDVGKVSYDSGDESLKPTNPIFEIYVCYECSQPFSFLSDIYLIAHKILSHDQTIRKLTYSDIKPTLSNYEHKYGNFVLTDDLNCLAHEISVMIERRFICHNCHSRTSFNFKFQYIEHQKVVHERRLETITRYELLPLYYDQSDNSLFSRTENDLTCFKYCAIHADEKVWTCEEYNCAISYCSKFALQKHYKDKHNTKVQIRGLTCPVTECNQTFVTNKQLIKHGVQDHDKYLAEHDFNFRKKIMNLETHQDKRIRKYECDFCKRRYLTKNTLSSHLKTHLEKNTAKDLMCSYCGGMFKSTTSLKLHIEQKHESVYVNCPVCNRVENLLYMKKHYEVHQQQDVESSSVINKNLLCNTCGKVLKTKSGYDLHQKSHKDIKNYVCNICDARFTSVHGLKSHQNTHKGELRRVFKCEMCSKVFGCKQTLNRHYLTHAGIREFTCEICSKHFYTLSELQRHKNTHSNDFKYKCKTCERGFKELTTFRLHIMRHKNIKPFKCSICERRFIFKYKLNRHLESQHNVQVDKKPVYKDPQGYFSINNLLEMDD